MGIEPSLKTKRNERESERREICMRVKECPTEGEERVERLEGVNRVISEGLLA